MQAHRMRPPSSGRMPRSHRFRALSLRLCRQYQTQLKPVSP